MPASLLAAPGRIWTADDLEALPEAAFYEIVDGALVVSPPPSLLHQAATAAIQAMLTQAAPPDLLVFGPGIDLGLTLRIPDVLVMSRTPVRRGVKLAPPTEVLLAVEVLSPSSRTTDRITKRHEYATAGIPSYWIIDADAPSLVELSGPDYSNVRDVAGEEWFETEAPFPVRFRPIDLLP